MAPYAIFGYFLLYSVQNYGFSLKLTIGNTIRLYSHIPPKKTT